MDREKVIEGLEAIREFFGFGLPSQSPTFEAYQNILTDALALLKEQETANLYKCPNCGTWVSAENVVRCMDCKYAHKTYDGDCKYCDMFTDDDGNPIERYRSGDWFCADGERR